MPDDTRKEQYRRNVNLEKLLAEINGLLGPVENTISSNFKQPAHPIVFVIGNPRGGKTLFMQWLASTGAFAYPSNLLSRFYAAPAIGAKIVRMLTDPKFSFRDEISEFQQQVSFVSDIGKTRGALSPNEFYYFWRRFFPEEAVDYLHASEMKNFRGAEFAAELAAIVDAFEGPFALKGDIANQNVASISNAVEKSFFLYVKRQPFFNIQSILQARERHTGSRANWWSFKPREYDALKTLDPVSQVAGQVYYLNQGVEKELATLPAGKQLWVSYEEFCGNPGLLYEKIRVKLADMGCAIPAEYTGPKNFSAANEVRLGGDDVKKIIEAYRHFSGETISAAP